MPNENEVKTEALQLADRATAITIATDEDYQSAASFLLDVKSMRKKIAEFFSPMKKAADEAKRAILSREHEADDPLANAESIVKPKMALYSAECERRQREEEAKRQAEARRQEEESRLAQAERLEEAGQHEEADAIIDAPMFVAPVVPIEQATPKVSGIATRDVWKFRIVNEALIPRQYLSVDPIKIGAVVRGLKGATQIPGIEVYPEKVVAAGRR